MKQHSLRLARATALLFAAVALPATPLLAQDIQALPAPVQAPAPAPAPVPVTPPVAVTPPVVTPAPTPRVTPPPVVSVAPPAAPEAAPAAEEAAPRQRTAQREAPRPRARAAAPAAAAPVAAAPVAAAPSALTPTPEAAPAPVTEPAPPPAEPVAVEPAAAPASATQEGSGPWLWLIAGLAVIAAIAGFLAWRRRRAAQEDYYYAEEAYVEESAEEPYVEPVAAEPVTAPAVVAAATPVTPAYYAPLPQSAAPVAEPVSETESVSVERADSEDIASMVAASEAPSGRPWIELLMRPIRAGVEKDEAVVEFELTVGNAGGVEAKDVRVSSWMFAAGSPQDSEMERMLIEPPADATLEERDIAPGEGARIEAAIALPTARAANGRVLPVLVADARYTLPDGSQGRTSASFEIGLARDGGLAAFPVDGDGLSDDIDARLHREPEHA